MTGLHQVDWSKIPAPEADGAAAHLRGMRLPSLGLRATDDSLVDLSRLTGLTVVYAYPRTGEPSVPVSETWAMIPGARGCTAQCCAFRDRYADVIEHGVDHVFGLSTQDTTYQREAAERLALPFSLLSDERLDFARALHLPTFETGGMVLLKRLTMVIRDGTIEHVFYPVFPPDRNAEDVIAWIASAHGGETV